MDRVNLLSLDEVEGTLRFDLEGNEINWFPMGPVIKLSDML